MIGSAQFPLFLVDGVEDVSTANRNPRLMQNSNSNESVKTGMRTATRSLVSATHFLCHFVFVVSSLVTGDIHGNFHSLFTRVGKVHSSKNGPFHALLCVGTIFGRKGEAELMEYIHGQKQGQKGEESMDIGGRHHAFH